jgi:hypothetical protein
MGQLIAWLAPIAVVFNHLARQSSLDKNGFAVQAGDTARFVVKRFDASDGHATFPQKNRAIVAFMRVFSISGML